MMTPILEKLILKNQAKRITHTSIAPVTYIEVPDKSILIITDILWNGFTGIAAAAITYADISRGTVTQIEIRDKNHQERYIFRSPVTPSVTGVFAQLGYLVAQPIQINTFVKCVPQQVEVRLSQMLPPALWTINTVNPAPNYEEVPAIGYGGLAVNLPHEYINYSDPQDQFFPVTRKNVDPAVFPTRNLSNQNNFKIVPSAATFPLAPTIANDRDMQSFPLYTLGMVLIEDRFIDLL